MHGGDPRSTRSTVPDLKWGNLKEMLNKHFIHDNHDSCSATQPALRAHHTRYQTCLISAKPLWMQLMSQTDLIQWFLNGLNDQMRPLYMTNYMGQNFTNSLSTQMRWKHALMR